MEVKTDNSYEAAFYLMRGAQLVAYENKPLARNVANKNGYNRQWLMTFEGVNEEDVYRWKNFKAFGNLRSYEAARRRLKRLMGRFS